MADLKARIGPKAIPGQFPHKTWVRPGYEAKPSSKRLASWQEERHGTEFDDGSTDDLDSSPVQLNTLTTNSQRKLSLFARMGIDEDTLEPVEVAKSLLDRIEVTADSGKYQDELSFRNATLGSRSMPIDVDALDGDSYDSLPLLNNSQPNVVVKPEPIEVDLDFSFNDGRAISAPNNESVIDINEHNKPESSKDWGVSFKNRPASQKRQTEELQRHDTPTAVVLDIRNGSTHLIEHDADSQALHRLENQSNNGVLSHTNHTEMPHVNGRKDVSSSSDPEEGELSDLPADQVRVAVLPLMLRIAEQRKMETASEEPSSIPTLLSPNVVTDEACSSFVRRANNVRKEISSHDSYAAIPYQDLQSKDICYSAPVRLESPFTVSQSVVRRIRSFDPREEGVNGVADGKATASSNEEPTPTFSPSAGEKSEDSSKRPSTSRNQQKSASRYTPSPLRDYVRSHPMSTQTSPTVSEHNYTKRRRSPSPRYHPRRSSFSRGRLYSKHSPYGHGRRTPDLDYRRWPPKAHEYHSPEPSPNRSRGREVYNHSSEQAQSRSSAHDVYSPKSEHGRYPRHNDQGRLTGHFTGDPLQDSRYQTHSPPSPIEPFFHDRDMQYSPEPVSPSQHHNRSSYHTSGYNQKELEDKYFSGPQSRSSQQRQGQYDRERQKSYTSPLQLLHRLPGRNSYSPDRQNQPRESIHNHQMATSSRSIKSSYSKEDYGQEKRNMPYDEHPKVEESQPSQVPLHGKGQQLHLPCHNVPGLWFVKLGLDELGTLDCKFDVDHNTAKKWNLLPLDSPGSHHTDIVPLKTSQKQLSLQICSFSRQLVDEMIQTHNSETAPEDTAKSIFALPQSWPAAGHLIITINPGAHNTRTWLPHEFGPNHPPIQIEDFVFEGNNIVQFIQLSGMPETIFALFAAERVKDFLDTTPLLPLQPANAETTANSIRVNAGSVSVLQLNS